MKLILILLNTKIILNVTRIKKKKNYKVLFLKKYKF